LAKGNIYPPPTGDETGPIEGDLATVDEILRDMEPVFDTLSHSEKHKRRINFCNANKMVLPDDLTGFQNTQISSDSEENPSLSKLKHHNTGSSKRRHKSPSSETESSSSSDSDSSTSGEERRRRHRRKERRARKLREKKQRKKALKESKKKRKSRKGEGRPPVHTTCSR
jgi:hypothetical protein